MNRNKGLFAGPGVMLFSAAIFGFFGFYMLRPMNAAGQPILFMVLLTWTLRGAAVLFVVTCGSTFLVNGPAYAGALMGILLAHEFGHFFQARRYGVPASLPYFIPMPLTPIGTIASGWDRRFARSRAAPCRHCCQ